MNNGSPDPDRALQDVSPPQSFSPEPILTQLERIVSSTEFAASQQLCRFLTYIVEQTLLGKSDALKAYTIALEVFERGTDFNPQIDPVVRVCARRLRQALQHYYLTEGRHDPIRIDVPKGAYVPTFQEHHLTPALPDSGQRESSVNAATAQHDQLPTIAVCSLENLSEKAEHAYFATGLTEELVMALMRFPDIIVIGPLQQNKLKEHGLTLPDVSREYGVRFVLDGSTQWYNGSLRVRAKLIDATTGMNVWGETYQYALNTDDWFGIEDEVVSRVVATLADNFGVIPRTLSHDSRPQSLCDSTAYDAILRFHHAMVVVTPETIQQAMEALDQTLARQPDHVTALAMLADLHAVMFQLGMSEEAALDQADSLARRAIALNPNHPHARWVIGFVYFFRGDADACVRECDAALTLNPNHANLLGTTGYMLAMVGEWERGRSLTEKAMRLNPHYPGWYHFVSFFDHYRHTNYEAALKEALRFNTPGFFMDPLIRAAVLGQLGRRTQANTALQELLSLLPDFPTIGRERLHRLVFSEAHVEMLWDGLLKAGLSAQP